MTETDKAWVGDTRRIRQISDLIGLRSYTDAVDLLVERGLARKNPWTPRGRDEIRSRPTLGWIAPRKQKTRQNGCFPFSARS